MCIGESDHFGVGKGAVSGFDDVYPNSDESSCLGFEDCRPEGATSLSGDVGQCELDDESHTIGRRHDRVLLPTRKTDGPGWEAKGGRGGEPRRHDGSESFNASRFFVTMASPFFVETSMPVAQTVRHSSNRSSFWRDCASP